MIRRAEGHDHHEASKAVAHFPIRLFPRWARGRNGTSHESVAYREVHEEREPTRLNFVAYWRQENGNPTLRPFLDMLRERYPDLSANPRPD